MNCLRAPNKFFGSRRLRASPQGYSPWTSLGLLREHPPSNLLRWRDRVSRAGRWLSEADDGGTEAVGSAQPRSRASSPGATPAGDDGPIVSFVFCQQDLLMLFYL